MFSITPDFAFQFVDTGHMLGGSAIYMKFKEKRKTKTLCYTGDIGRYNKKILQTRTLSRKPTTLLPNQPTEMVHTTLDKAEENLF